jgi:hypothetical protein
MTKILEGSWALAFVCPECREPTQIIEAERCYAITPVAGFDVVDWSEDLDGNQTCPVGAMADYGNTYHVDHEDEYRYFCQACDYELPVSCIDELFGWLEQRGMLRRTDEQREG